MTIEEKARQRAEEIEKEQTLGVYDNDEDFVRDSAFNDGFVEGYEEGYIAGAKENGIALHDLRKAPNDLPKDDENFICMLEDGHKLECYYDPTTKKWYDNFFHHDIEYGYYQSKVIAWCKMPQFKE